MIVMAAPIDGRPAIIARVEAREARRRIHRATGVSLHYKDSSRRGSRHGQIVSDLAEHGLTLADVLSGNTD